MNCQSVIASMGFRCRDIGGETLRIWSPFTYGNDGQRIGLYVEKTATGYRVTDNCEALRHASSMGINLTANKINAVRRSVGFEALVSDGGEISAYVTEEKIGQGVASVLNATLAVSHLEGHWAPKARADSFTKTVADVLESVLGERVARNVTVTGASGHQLELPLAVRLDSLTVYVQPIASTEQNTVDWKNVYAGWGRMTDLKNAALPDATRMFVLEEASNDGEMTKAMSVLAEAASIVQYRNLRAWAEQKAA